MLLPTVAPFYKINQFRHHLRCQLLLQQRPRGFGLILEKLQGSISLVDFKTWRRWDDFGRLNQLSTYPAEEQTAALHPSLDTTMQQTVEVTLNLPPNNTTLPSEILEVIANHIRLKRNVALDRIAFEECHQNANETFDTTKVFYTAEEASWNSRTLRSFFGQTIGDTSHARR